MRALHTIEQHRPTRSRRARPALVGAAVTHSASHGLTADNAKGQITQYTYGARGQLLTRTDAAGKKTAYTYNALGQVLTAQTPEVTYSHAYDPAHRLAAVTDSRAGKKLSYAWSPGGLLNLMTDNEGHRTDYLYDSVGRLTGIWAPNDDYVSFVYDAGGRLTEKWYPNGINAQYTWNSDNTLAQVRNRFNYSDTFIVSQHDYSYNGVGQRKDALEKLGAYTPPAMNEAYAYDPLGNRTTKSARLALVDAAFPYSAWLCLQRDAERMSMLHKTFGWMIACTFVSLTGQSFAGECFTAAADGVTVNQCADEKPVFLPKEGVGGLKAEPLSAHKDGFGQPGKYGFYGADHGEQPKRVETPRDQGGKKP